MRVSCEAPRLLSNHICAFFEVPEFRGGGKSEQLVNIQKELRDMKRIKFVRNSSNSSVFEPE